MHMRGLRGLYLFVLFLTFAFAAPGRSGSKSAPKPWPAVEVKIVPGVPEPASDTPRWKVLVVVRSTSPGLQTVTPQVQLQNARLLQLKPSSATVQQGTSVAFYAHVEGNQRGKNAAMNITLKEVPGYDKTSALPMGVELRLSTWSVSGVTPIGEAPPEDASAWSLVQLPAWPSVEDRYAPMARGVKWFRTRLAIPAAWTAQKLHLTMRVQADTTVALVNGKRVGRTEHGRLRDRQLTYTVPPENIRWGQENELTIGLENARDSIDGLEGLFSSPGVGLRDAPFTIVAGAAPPESWPFAPIGLQTEQARRAPGPVGSPLPVRPIVAHNGVLRYQDGKEVALWGTGYYSWRWQHTSDFHGEDPRRTIDQDIADFERAGVNVVRIHVRDVQISDSEGNLTPNDRLDLVDYMVDQCNKHNIYLVLTPMAWWSAYDPNPGAFSSSTSIQAQTMWPNRWKQQTKYLKQFLTHKNPYTGRRIVDEPSVVMFEVINEPHYWWFNHIMTDTAPLWRLTESIAKEGRAGIRESWKNMVPDASWMNPVTYAWYRYETLRRYLDTVVVEMRSTGAKQPIAFSYFCIKDPDLIEGFADSRIDVATLSAYPGGLFSILDGTNLLGRLDTPDALRLLDARMAEKARMVYEFDAAGMVRQSVLYPAMAAHWRRLGVQIACQFQYDPKVEAGWNPEWGNHYLNLWHTPQKAASFLIGGELFRHLPRGATFTLPADDQILGPAAVSFERQVSFFSNREVYMQTGETGWRPLPLPSAPKHILSVGSSPFFEYAGTGIVDLKVEDRIATVYIYPDVERTARGSKAATSMRDMSGTKDQPLTILRETEHPFTLRLDGWTAFRVERVERNSSASVEVKDGSFMAKAGEYRLVH
jgi:hypothetical protein